MLVLLSLTLGLVAGLSGRSATYASAAIALVACWAAAALVSGSSLFALALAILTYNSGLGLSLIISAVRPAPERLAR